MKNQLPVRVTVPSIISQKGSSKKVSALTAYDYTMARLIDASGVDIVLVGDSLGCIVQGHNTTLPVNLEHVMYHTECVARGVTRALVVADMPFMSYQVSIEQAIESAGKLIKVGAAAVKLEGGTHMAETVSRLVEIDIPVMGHVGLTPQSFHRMGGNKVQGKKSGMTPGCRDKIIQDAVALEKAGAFCVVIESVPKELATEITKLLAIPTIGIGAGVGCDGQVLVTQDMLGMVENFSPRFVKRYAELGLATREALRLYVEEVQGSSFPTEENSFSEISIKPTNGVDKRINH